MRAKALEFLKEYEKICQKYNIGLDSCGCCGSPYLNLNDIKDINDIYYNKQLKCITLELHYNNEGEYVPYTLDEYIKKEA